MLFSRRLMGTPWVYERLRVWLLGGGPAEEVYGWLGDTREDIIIDIGCGTGMALERLNGFREYHGFDTDSRALDRFRRRGLPGNVYLYNSEPAQVDLDRIQPTRALLMGFLHHVPDAKAAQLLSMLARCRGLRNAITLDPVVIEGRRLNNLLCRLDRGRHVRAQAQYEALMKGAGFEPAKGEVFRSGNGAAVYFCTLLRRP